MSVKTVDVNASTIEDAFEQSGLTWIAQESEMINATNMKVIEGKKCIYRNDNNVQLGVVGMNYGIIQSSDCFAFFNAICAKHNANICKITEYHGGSLVNLSAEVRDKKFDVRVGDEVGFRFDLWNSFDGFHPASVSFSALRLICLNGLVSQGKDATTIRIRHSVNAVSRLEQATAVWAGGENWFTAFKENSKKLAQKMVDKAMVDKFVNDLLGDSDSKITSRKKDSIIQLFEGGKGNGQGTAWDLLNGATEHIDHFSKKNADDMLEFAHVGEGYNLKAKAFDLAMNLL